MQFMKVWRPKCYAVKSLFEWAGCLFLGIRLSGLEKNYWADWAEILKSGDLLILDSARIWAGFITLFFGLKMQVSNWAMKELGLDQGSLVVGLVLRTEFGLGWHELDLVKWVKQDPTQSSLSSPNWSFPLFMFLSSTNPNPYQTSMAKTHWVQTTTEVILPTKLDLSL